MLLYRFLLLVLTLAAVPAPTLMAQQQHPMNNTDLVKLVQAGVPESAIIASIRSSTPAFDLSSDGLIALHKAGVTQGELEAAIAASNTMHPSPGPNAPPAATSAVPASLPSVALLVNGTPRQLTLEKVQLAQTKAKPTSLSSLSGDTMVNQAVQTGVNASAWEAASHVSSPAGYIAAGSAGGLMAGAMRRHQSSGVTYVWGIPGAPSTTISSTTSPAFMVNVAAVPGVNPDDYEPAIIKLTPSGNSVRLLGATQGKENAHSNPVADWQVYSNFIEDRVAIEKQELGKGQFRISPASPLLPGEYGVVLRPVSKSKQFSGADIMRGQGDGMIFDAAWSFQVPAGAPAH
jgi:hypothetical protein